MIEPKMFDRDTDRAEIAKGGTVVESEQWVKVPNGYLFSSCCDCGLSHVVEIRGHGGAELEIRHEMDATLTEQARAAREFPVMARLAAAEKRLSDVGEAPKRFNNLVKALAEDAAESPFTREEWDRVDKQTAELIRERNELSSKLSSERSERLAAQDRLNKEITDERTRYAGIINGLQDRLDSAEKGFRLVADEMNATRGELALVRAKLRCPTCATPYQELDRGYKPLCLCHRSAEFAALESRLDEITTKYHELIYLVGNKFPDESRHETAKRYLAAFEALGSANSPSAAVERRVSICGGPVLGSEETRCGRASGHEGPCDRAE